MDSSESFNSDPFTFAGTKRKKIYSPSQNRIFRSPARKAKKISRQVKNGRVAKAGKRIYCSQRKGSLLSSQTQQSDITGLTGNNELMIQGWLYIVLTTFSIQRFRHVKFPSRCWSELVRLVHVLAWRTVRFFHLALVLMEPRVTPTLWVTIRDTATRRHQDIGWWRRAEKQCIEWDKRFGASK